MYELNNTFILKGITILQFYDALEIKGLSFSGLNFSQPSHGGILEPTDSFFSPTLACCHTHTHTQTHTYTDAQTHAHPHSQGSPTFTVTQGDTPLSFENTQSPFTPQNPHTPRPVCSGTLYQHTHALPHTHAQTHKHSHTLH